MRRHLLVLPSFVCEMLHKNAIIKCNKIKFRTQFIFLFQFLPSRPFGCCICRIHRMALIVWVSFLCVCDVALVQLLPPFDTFTMFAIIHNGLYSRALSLSFSPCHVLFYIFFSLDINPFFRRFHSPRILSVCGKMPYECVLYFFVALAYLSFLIWIRR